MPDLVAHAKRYIFDALQRFPIEILDQPVGDEGDNILIDGGVDDGDDLLTEASDFLVSDGTSVLKLTYHLKAEPHVYVLTALEKSPPIIYDSYAVGIFIPVAGAEYTTYPVEFGWAYSTTIPVKVFTYTGYVPTVTQTWDFLITENGEYLVQEVSGDNLLKEQ